MLTRYVLAIIMELINKKYPLFNISCDIELLIAKNSIITLDRTFALVWDASYKKPTNDVTFRGKQSYSTTLEEKWFYS